MLPRSVQLPAYRMATYEIDIKQISKEETAWKKIVPTAT
jgi:hypothetical protein